jgi:hypothetical protein
MQIKKRAGKYVSAFMALATLATLAVAVPALAQDTTSSNPPAWGQGGSNRGNMKPGVFGTVSSISGNIITVTSKNFNPNSTSTSTSTTTTYTVDATNAKITKDNATVTISSIAVGDTIMAQGTLTGTNLVATEIRDGIMKNGDSKSNANAKPGVFGTVSSISGNIITVTSKQSSDTTATYTVDATSATITKDNATGTIASIVVGDTIMAQGTLTGTNLVATTIRDGVMMNRGSKTGTTTETSQTPSITGNGEPLVAGTVSAISGATLTITNKSNVTYTVDATNAKVVQGQNTISISGIAVGDDVVAQGTVNGNSVVASSVIDQKPATTASSTTTTHKGFFGSIGSFFSKLFGF